MNSPQVRQRIRFPDAGCQTNEPPSYSRLYFRKARPERSKQHCDLFGRKGSVFTPADEVLEQIGRASCRERV